MTQQKSKPKKTPRAKTSGYAIDTGFRLKHEPSGTEFALLVCKDDFVNGWLEETKDGRLSDTVGCYRHDDECDPTPVMHRILDFATGIEWFFEGGDQATIGLATVDVIANLLSPPSSETRRAMSLPGARS